MGGDIDLPDITGRGTTRDLTRPGATGTGAPGHRLQHPEQVFEEGRDTHNDPQPNRQKLGGTPLGSDPRE